MTYAKSRSARYTEVLTCNQLRAKGFLCLQMTGRAKCNNPQRVVISPYGEIYFLRFVGTDRKDDRAREDGVMPKLKKIFRHKANNVAETFSDHDEAVAWVLQQSEYNY